MDENVQQDLWEFDIDVTRKGSFTIMAKSLEEAKARIAEMDDDEIVHFVSNWHSCEAEVS